MRHFSSRAMLFRVCAVDSSSQGLQSRIPAIMRKRIYSSQFNISAFWYSRELPLSDFSAFTLARKQANNQRDPNFFTIWWPYCPARWLPGITILNEFLLGQHRPSTTHFFTALTTSHFSTSFQWVFFQQFPTRILLRFFLLALVSVLFEGHCLVFTVQLTTCIDS